MTKSSALPPMLIPPNYMVILPSIRVNHLCKGYARDDTETSLLTTECIPVGWSCPPQPLDHISSQPQSVSRYCIYPTVLGHDNKLIQPFHSHSGPKSLSSSNPKPSPYRNPSGPDFPIILGHLCQGRAKQRRSSTDWSLPDSVLAGDAGEAPGTPGLLQFLDPTAGVLCGKLVA